jgi:trehalose 6-phosphate synthase/phosphatase
MLGVDRLDMVKGIPQKLLAFEKFLEEHAEWRDKVRKCDLHQCDMCVHM